MTPEWRIDALLAADEQIAAAMWTLAEHGEGDVFVALSMVRKQITDRLHQINRKS